MGSASKAKAFMVNYGARGKIITVDQLISNKPYINLSLLIERPQLIPLRHKITIGTDKKDWEILYRASSSKNDNNYYRSYVIRDNSYGALIGYVFYKGVMLKLEWMTRSDEKILQSIRSLTDTIGQRIRDNYVTAFAPIVDTMEGSYPEITRPDLPEPDDDFKKIESNLTLMPIISSGSIPKAGS